MFPSERVSGDNKCFPAKGPFLIHLIERDWYLPKITPSVDQRILKQNFFELINEMRVGEAKRRLLLPENAGHTVDSLYEECGFRTRSTFFLAFKKVEGLSPAQWLNSVKKHTDQ